MLRKSPALDAWAAIFKNAYLKVTKIELFNSFLKVTKLSKL